MMKKTGKFFRNKYLITLLVFGVWMIFFDANSLPRQWRLMRERKGMEATVMENKKEIEMVKRKSKMLEENKSLEKYAREEFRFKKKNEEIFVIVEKEN